MTFHIMNIQGLPALVGKKKISFSFIQKNYFLLFFQGVLKYISGHNRNQ